MSNSITTVLEASEAYYFQINLRSSSMQNILYGKSCVENTSEEVFIVPVLIKAE